MKPIQPAGSSQEPGTNDTLVGINNGLLFKIYRYPYVFLSVCWIGYTFLDVTTTLKLGLDFNWKPGAVNLAFAFFVSAILFYVFFPAFRDLRSLWKAPPATAFLVLALYLKIEIDNSISPTQAPASHAWIEEGVRLFHYSVIVFVVWSLKVVAENSRKAINAEVYAKSLRVRNQILGLSPHFFLNVLNDIRGKAAGISKVLLEDLTHLNNFLTYCLNSDKDDNSVVFEIDAIESFLHLQDLRFGDTIHFESAISIDRQLLTKDIFFPKTALLNLVENSFKHGDLTNANHPGRLQITLRVDPETSAPILFFDCSNRIKPKKEYSFGGGLSNRTIKELLAVFLPKVNWKETVSETNYRLQLTINYQKDASGWYS